MTVAIVVAVLVLSSTAPPGAGAEDPPVGHQPVTAQVQGAAATGVRPNVIVIMTDDQTLEQMRVMSQTRSLIGNQGATFTNAVANTPECCPSRATYLTGQYTHNHHVYTSGEAFGGYVALDPSETLPVWLDRAGYFTAHVGKYLNGYGEMRAPDIPPGWEHWWGLMDPYTYYYYNYQIYQNGTVRTYGNTPADYQTDVLAAHVVDLIHERADTGQPFFINFSPVAPHTGSRFAGDVPWPWAAPRHYNDLHDGSTHQPASPSLNEADVSDKPAAIQALPLYSETKLDGFESWYLGALESLLAVDEAVGDIVDALAVEGVLDNTYIIFTSDNGYLYGEHRLLGKWWGYQEAYRVPLLIRGPGIPAGVIRNQRAGIVDLAPTILDLAGAMPGLEIDGIPLQALIEHPNGGQERTLLVEAGPPSGRHYATVTDLHSTYTLHSSGEEELYNLAYDPYQMDNRASHWAYRDVRIDLAARLEALQTCQGEQCHVGVDGLPGRFPWGCYEDFYDVPLDHPFCADIAWVVTARIGYGFPDGTFRPGGTMTRQGLAGWLYARAGSPSGPFPVRFSDVPADHPYANAIGWLAMEGIATGFPDGTFRPGGALTRQAVAAFLHREAGTPAVSGTPSFPDVPASHTFATPIAWLTTTGATSGYTDGLFHPMRGLTRQALAAWLHRLEG